MCCAGAVFGIFQTRRLQFLKSSFHQLLLFLVLLQVSVWCCEAGGTLYLRHTSSIRSAMFVMLLCILVQGSWNLRCMVMPEKGGSHRREFAAQLAPAISTCPFPRPETRLLTGLVALGDFRWDDGKRHCRHDVKDMYLCLSCNNAMLLSSPREVSRLGQPCIIGLDQREDRRSGVQGFETIV